jgi:tRNA 2-thiouridine synthesizing protein A
MSQETLNARRLLCPLPVIRTQDKIKTLQAGDELTVIGTDPGILHDIPAWCRVHGHTVLDARKDDGEYVVVIVVGSLGCVL